MSSIASQHHSSTVNKDQAQPLMSPLLSPQDSLPLSPNLGRDHLAPLSPTESPHLSLAPASPLPSSQDKETEEAIAGPSHSSQDSWSPGSDQAKQGRNSVQFLLCWSWPNFYDSRGISISLYSVNNIVNIYSEVIQT